MHRPCGINWSVGLAVSLFFPASDESRPRKLLESQSRPTPLQGGTLLLDFHPKSGIDKHLFGHLTSSSLTYIVREDVDQGLTQNAEGNSRLGWRRSAPARSHLVCCFSATAPRPIQLGSADNRTVKPLVPFWSAMVESLSTPLFSNSEASCRKNMAKNPG